MPGYGADRPFMLAAHRSCAVKTDVQEFGTGSLVHTCDTLQGGSGAPVLLFQSGAPTVIGISTAILRGLGTRYAPAHGEVGVSAAQFEDAAAAAMK